MNRYMIEGIANDVLRGKHVHLIATEKKAAGVPTAVAEEMAKSDEKFRSLESLRVGPGLLRSPLEGVGSLTTHTSSVRTLIDSLGVDVIVCERVMLVGEQEAAIALGAFARSAGGAYVMLF